MSIIKWMGDCVKWMDVGIKWMRDCMKWMDVKVSEGEIA